MIDQNIETRMRWRKIGFWSLLAVTGLLVLSASWLWTADLGVFKPQIERWVSEKTGRTLSIGALSIDIAGRIVVVGRDITFANKDGTIPPHMVSVGHAEVEVEFASLFNPPVVIEAIEINDANIHLSAPADGAPNWELDLPDTAAEPEEEDSSGLPLLLRDARVFNLRFVYDSADRQEPLEVVVASFTQRLRDDAFLDLKTHGTLSGRDIAIEGEVGTWESLLAAEDIDYSLAGQFDTLTLASSGHIDDLSRPTQPTLSFEATGPDIDHLTEMLGLGDEGSGDIALAGGLSKDSAAGMRLHISGNLGETRIEASAEFTSLADFLQIDAQVRSSGPDLSQVLALAGVQGIHPAPFQLVADLERAGPELRVHKAEMLFGDAQFLLTANLPKFPAVDDGSAELSLKGPDLARLRRLTGLPGAASGPFAIEAGLSVGADQREFFDVAVETTHGRFKTDGEIRGGDTYLGTTAKLDLEIFDVTAMARDWQLDLGPLPAAPLTVVGAVEYVDGAIRTTRPLTARLGELDLGAEGSVTLAAGAVGSNLVIQASGDRLTLVTDPFTDSEYLPEDEFSVSGQVLVEAGAIRLDDLAGAVGSASIEGSARIVLAPGIAGSTIRFSAASDALEETVAHVPALAVQPGPFQLSGGLRFATDALHIEDLRLDRPMAELAGRFSLGMPIDRNWFQVELKGSSDDGRGILQAIQGFEAAEAPLAVDLAAERNGDTLRVDRFDVAMGDADASASGTLDFTEQLDSTRFRFTANIPSLARLGTVGGREFHDQSFTFDGTIDGARGQLRVENARMTVANSDVTGSMTYTVDGQPTLNIDVVSERLAIQPLFVAVENDEPEPVESPDGRVIPDVAIPFEALAKMDISLRVRIDEFERQELFLRNVALDASIEDGSLAIDDASFHARSGYVRGNASLHPDNGNGRAHFGLSARDLAFGLSNTNADLGMKGDIEINLDATGTDLRALAASSTGIVMLDTNGGKIPNNRVMQFLYGDVFDQILSVINPFMKSEPYTTFECLILPIEIAAGKLTTNPAAYIRTDKLNMTIKPDINLATERIDVSIRSTPRKVISISAAELINPYVKVIGTMDKPALAVDEQGVLISGGAAVATGGISLLAKAAWDRLSKSSDPCRSAREQAVENLSPRFPDIPPLEPLPPVPVPPAAELGD